MTDSSVVAVLLDLVDSREITARSSVQIEIERGFAAVDAAVPALEPLHPTVGDEFQALYASVSAALGATLQARLALPPGVDCRVGIGRGDVRVVGAGVAGDLQDGPGWWRARAAIDRAHALEDGAVPTARGWFIGSDAPGAEEAAVNAYLLTRDALVGEMSDRDRRLVLGTARGLPQKVLAEQESITQSAVSQALRRAGAGALLTGARLLADAC
ncbi:SatD family protein [Rathayibacter festucae]|uniref:SatD family protein n=1 Tax=Rathayibacter festucae TaxID=110937 RepID=UPI002A698C2E|nr:SatD family protein [Rathayibacter festucae]MDY0912175.1 SatD family protein [Rathayibacter festucae]